MESVTGATSGLVAVVVADAMRGIGTRVRFGGFATGGGSRWSSRGARVSSGSAVGHMTRALVVTVDATVALGAGGANGLANRDLEGLVT